MPEQEVPEAGGGQEQDQHDHGHHIAHHHAIQLGPAEMLAVFLHLIDDPADQDAGEETDKGHQEAVADVVHHVQKLSGAAVGQGQLEVEHVVAKADGHGGHQRIDAHHGAHFLAALVEDLHAVCHQRFHDGYAAGQRREAKGQEEHDADDPAHAAHGGEHPGQADEGQAGSAWPRRQCQEQQHKDDRGDLRGDEGGKEAILSRLGSVRDQIDREILGDPAADDGVVGHDEGGNQEGQISQKTQLLMQSPEGVQCVLLGPAADGHVRGQQCEAEGQHQHQIHQQEQAAAVLGAEIEEAPDIADAYGSTACGRQDEAQRAAETTVFVFRFAHSFLSFCLQQ